MQHFGPSSLPHAVRNREPSHNVTPQPTLRKDIPDGFHLPRSAGHRPHPAVLRVRFHESVNAMFGGTLARGNGIPQHGGKNRTQSGQVSHYTVIDKVIESGHQAPVEEGIDYFPVGRIPTDEENSRHAGERIVKEWARGPAALAQLR